MNMKYILSIFVYDLSYLSLYIMSWPLGSKMIKSIIKRLIPPPKSSPIILEVKTPYSLEKLITFHNHVENVNIFITKCRMFY